MTCGIVATAHAWAKQESVRDPGACRPTSSGDPCRHRGLAPHGRLITGASFESPKPRFASFAPTYPLVRGAARGWERGLVVRRGPLRVSATREGRSPSQAPQAPPRVEGPSLRAGGAGSAGPVTVWEGVAARRSRRHAKRTTAGQDGVAAGRGPETIRAPSRFPNRRLSLTRFRMHVRAQDGHDGNGRSEAPRGTVRGCGSEGGVSCPGRRHVVASALGKGAVESAPPAPSRSRRSCDREQDNQPSRASRSYCDFSECRCWRVASDPPGPHGTGSVTVAVVTGGSCSSGAKRTSTSTLSLILLG